MENIGLGVPFSDLGQTRVSDLGNLSAEKYPLGFMDLLGVHRYALNLMTHTPPVQFQEIPNEENEEEKVEDGEEHQYKTNTWFKSRKSSEQTKTRVPKVSFITKSEVLHLDDGYKWRKYGQKPVKNSPFPRNYYRCTTTGCDVKKRVERSLSDPSTVITTYEGQHTHHRPGVLIMPKRGSTRSNASPSGPHFGLPIHSPQFHQLFDYNNQQQEEGLSFSGPMYIGKQENEFDDDAVDDHVIKKSRTRDLLDGAALVKDHDGLLQDVVSSHIVKEES